jgi:hypothetical protein
MQELSCNESFVSIDFRLDLQTMEFIKSKINKKRNYLLIQIENNFNCISSLLFEHLKCLFKEIQQLREDFRENYC